MSFGFSVGDFITVFRLVNDVRKQFVNAPDQFSGISQDVKTLSTVLRDVEDTLSDYEDLSDDRKKRLEEVCSACKTVLNKVNCTLKEFSVLDPPAQGRARRLRVAWKRLKWEQSDIDQLRSQLALNISAFDTFLQSITNQTTLEIKADVNYLRHNEETRETKANFTKVLDWLSPIDFHPQQRDYITKRKEGTGAWFLESMEFKDWVLQPGATLLCPGIPGAGKTILVSTIVDHLQDKFVNDPDIGVAYIYFNYQRSQEQEPLHLLGSLVRQLTEANGPQNVPANIQALFKNHDDGQQPLAMKDIMAAFTSAIKAYTKVLIILDALDEYQDRLQNLLSTILEVRQADPFSLLATTRPLSAVTIQLPTAKVKEIRADDGDVLSYINSRMGELLSSRISRHPHLQELVRTEVLKATDGMFLLARLHLDSLRNWLVPGDLKLAVLSLPKGLAGLDDTYNNAMERIEAQPPGFRKLALNVLTWVIHAQKPLSPQLLLEASTIQPGSHGLDEDFRPDLEDIDSLCAGLVAIDTDSNVVRLVHYTTQEYFERRDWFPRAHFYITEACITYLSFDIFDAIQERHPDLWMFYPFYKYAATSWAHHAQISSYDEALLFRFLQNDAQADMNLRALDIQVNIYGYYGISFISSFAPLVLNTPDNSSDSGVHLTAYFGLTSLMRKLVEKGQSAESRDYAGRTPLWYAAYSGHSETVRALLQDYHVNPNAADHDGCSVLHIAVRIGHVSIVNTLLEIETLNTDIRNDQGYTALTWAARNHNWHLVDILLKDRCVRLTVTEKRSLALSLVEAFSHKADENDPEVTRIRLDLCHRLDMPYPLTRLLPIQQSQTEGTPLPDS